MGVAGRSVPINVLQAVHGEQNWFRGAGGEMGMNMLAFTQFTEAGKVETQTTAPSVFDVGIHERLPQNVDLDDLISAGVVGLIDAFSKFDYTKKVQFKSYAQFRIRGAILDSLRTLDWSPRELRRKGRAVEEAIRAVTQRIGHAPSEQEIAAELNMSLAEYQQLLGDLKGLEIGSLHMERSEESGDEELAYIPGSPEEDPLFRCLKGEMKQRLADAIDDLPEKERMVLTLYYYEELTMKEIGLTLGVVESRVSQIHSSAVLRLRTALAGLSSSGSTVRNGTSERRKTALR